MKPTHRTGCWTSYSTQKEGFQNVKIIYQYWSLRGLSCLRTFFTREWNLEPRKIEESDCDTYYVGSQVYTSEGRVTGLLVEIDLCFEFRLGSKTIFKIILF